MGRRARARGNSLGRGAREVVGGASMGPRARARGNSLGRGAREVVGGASMGPRARARGNSLYLIAPTVIASLQWGHERALVEIPPGGRRVQHADCFNGATSARSWKSGR